MVLCNYFFLKFIYEKEFNLVLLFGDFYFLFAQDKDEKALAGRVELFRLAVIAADEKYLNEVTVEKLSYGHSVRLIEDKKEFIRKIISNENMYLKLDHIKTSLLIYVKAAVIRLKFQLEPMSE